MTNICKHETIHDIVKRACEQPTLIDALSFVSVWDTDRAVRQSKDNGFKSYETFSKFLIKEVLENYYNENKPMFKKDDIVIDTVSSITYVILDDIEQNKDALTGESLYRYSRNPINKNEAIMHCSQIQMESGRFQKLHSS